VQQPVVAPAQEHQVVEGSGAAVGPMHHVMRIASPR
jgi:hypothetical protein